MANKGLIVAGAAVVGLAAVGLLAGRAEAAEDDGLPPPPGPQPSPTPKPKSSANPKNARNHPKWAEYKVARDNCQYWKKLEVTVVEGGGEGTEAEAEQAILDQVNVWCAAYAALIQEIEGDGYVIADDDLAQY